MAAAHTSGHLYVHLPFCAHRCGYCDFVTVVGHGDEHGAYVDALLAELEQERHVLCDRLDSVFLGGGTPTFTEPRALQRVLEAVPPAAEVTVEANPETVTAELAALLRDGGVNRVSLGAQSLLPGFCKHWNAGRDRTMSGAPSILFVMPVLTTFHSTSSTAFRARSPPTSSATSRRRSRSRRSTSPATSSRRSRARDSRTPSGTSLRVRQTQWRGISSRRRVTHRGRIPLVRDGELLSRRPRAHGRDLRARHNLGIWLGLGYLGIGIGAVSTVGRERRRNLPSLGRYIAALRAGEGPPRELELLDPPTQVQERIMLGLRLDQTLPLEGLEHAIDAAALERLVAGGLVERVGDDRSGGAYGGLRLTRRGRFLGGGVTAELLV